MLRVADVTLIGRITEEKEKIYLENNTIHNKIITPSPQNLKIILILIYLGMFYEKSVHVLLEF